MRRLKYLLLVLFSTLIPSCLFVLINFYMKMKIAVLVLLLLPLLPATVYIVCVMLYLEYKARRALFIITGVIFIVVSVWLTANQGNTVVCVLNMGLLMIGLWLTTNRLLFYLAEKLLDGKWWKFLLNPDNKK